MSETEPHKTNPNERLVLFSDAVIAIAITLLVLDIRLPEGFGEYSDAELWAALVALWPRFLAYFISFAVVAAYWLNHRAKFDHIVKASRGLTWINFLFLTTIGLVPFTTALIAENSGAVGTAVYAGMMVLSGLTLALIWYFAGRTGMIDPAFPALERRRLLISTLTTSAVFAVSVPLAFAHPDVAKFFWLLILPVNLGLRLIVRLVQRATGRA